MSGPSAFVTAIVCFFLGVGLATWIAYESHMEHAHESKAFALKQNGDTLFIPTQVVVKHDTLVVIQTTERRPIQDSIDAAQWISGTGTIVSYVGGSWTIERGSLEPKPYKQRDTIYEHKIIYY